MSADHFAKTIADTLFGPDQQTGRHLMRTAVHLIARGKPVRKRHQTRDGSLCGQLALRE